MSFMTFMTFNDLNAEQISNPVSCVLTTEVYL